MLLFAGVVGYTVWAIRRSRRESRNAPADDAARPPGPSRRGIQLLQIVGGLVFLGIGSKWLIDGAVTLARLFGVSDLVIGLTVVAVGTSLPELATSVLASLRGERDIAVGNVVGSNIFNLLCVLGLTAAIAPGGVPVPMSALTFDLPVMLTVAVACLPIFFTGHLIARWEGALFLGYYVIYTLFVALTAMQHHKLPMLTEALIWFALPLTAVTIGISLWRHRSKTED